MNGYIDFLVSSILIGMVCAVIAYRSGKDPWRWFFAGALLNVFGLALFMYMKKRGARVHAARG